MTIFNVAARKKVMDEPSFFDHRIIVFKVEENTTIPPLIRNPRKADWFPDRNHPKDYLEPIVTGREEHRPYDLEQYVEQISGAIM